MSEGDAQNGQDKPIIEKLQKAEVSRLKLTLYFVLLVAVLLLSLSYLQFLSLRSEAVERDKRINALRDDLSKEIADLRTENDAEVLAVVAIGLQANDDSEAEAKFFQSLKRLPLSSRRSVVDLLYTYSNSLSFKRSLEEFTGKNPGSPPGK